METGRKTYKEKLRPTPEQERQFEVILWRCRTLYNVALEQRKTAWERCHVWVKRYAQEAELAGIRAEFPEYAALHSHVLQDVLARLDKAYQAFFRRLAMARTWLPPVPGPQSLSLLHLQGVWQRGEGSRMAIWSSPRLGALLSTGPELQQAASKAS